MCVPPGLLGHRRLKQGIANVDSADPFFLAVVDFVEYSFFQLIYPEWIRGDLSCGMRMALLIISFCTIFILTPFIRIVPSKNETALTTIE